MKIIPCDKSTGMKLADYPESRIPEGYKNVVKVYKDEGYVDTMSGRTEIFKG